MFWHGCNYPWSTDGTTAFYGMDFGATVWGSHVGVSTRRQAIASDFAQMASLGFTVARWFVFCDGRSGIVYDDGGLPVGLDPHFFTDLDAALEIARDTGIRLVLVLLDRVDLRDRLLRLWGGSLHRSTDAMDEAGQRIAASACARGVEVIDKIVAGRERPANLALLEDLCTTMLDGSLCALGGLTPYPVLSALRHFPGDFERPPRPLAAE